MNFIKPKLSTALFFVLIFAIYGPLFGQSGEEVTVNWVTIEEAEALNRENPRKIFIDFYTDWCGWCKRMDATTFSNPIIAKYLNENFYAVKFNAEQTEPLTFRGTEFVNENSGQRRSAHNFAIAVLQGRMGYPSMAFFDENLDLITAMSGYRPPEGLEPILVFFNDDVYKQTSDLDGFTKSFQGSFD